MKKMVNNYVFIVIGIIIGIMGSILVFNYFDNKKYESISLDSETVEPLEYFKTIEKSSNENTLKNGFIKVVDFLFYDGEIGGKKFKELGNDAKVEIMKVFYSIDDKIDSLFPDYKEKISNETGKIYENIKEKTSELYVKTVNKICESNEELCAKVRNEFNNLSEKFNISFDYIKSFSNDELDKLKEWYIKFKNK